MEADWSWLSGCGSTFGRGPEERSSLSGSTRICAIAVRNRAPIYDQYNPEADASVVPVCV